MVKIRKRSRPATVTGNAHVTTDAVGEGTLRAKACAFESASREPANTAINPVGRGVPGAGHALLLWCMSALPHLVATRQ